MRVARSELGPGPSAAELLRRVADWPGLVCLDGAWADGTALLTSHPDEVIHGPLDAAALARLDAATPAEAGDDVGGGWFGHIAYDGTARFAFHDHVVRLVDGCWIFETLAADGDVPAGHARLDAWAAAVRSTTAAPERPWHVGAVTGAPRDEHLAAVERAVELIRAGELYQVNVCTRLSADVTGDTVAMAGAAVVALRPAFGAFLDLAGAGSLVSLSPELFLRLRGRDVRTAPIKGTLPRTSEPDDGDAADGNAARLRGSAKDAAENVMIVDLMRNDLGRVCEPGSVRVPDLLSVQPHPGVWHLVSTVTGRLRDGVGAGGLLDATFPPGSVTGAPKVRAVRAVGELETAPRGAYTGALGFVSPVWGAEFAVAIRTFEIADGRIELGVGGGVTADSVPMLEWRECLHKAAPLLRAVRAVGPVPPPDRAVAGALLETVLAVDGVPLRLADHLARLDRSCRELFGHGLPDDVHDLARHAVAGRPGRAVLRVVVQPDGRVDVSAAALGPAPTSSRAVTVVRAPGSWRHKWADRGALSAAEQAAAPAVPLFLAADGTVLETSRGNVFLVAGDGTLVTPPLRDEVLPGVTRRAVLDLARDEGRPTRVAPFGPFAMRAYPAFWTSSLSGAVAIHEVDGVAVPRADDVVHHVARALTTGIASTR